MEALEQRPYFDWLRFQLELKIALNGVPAKVQPHERCSARPKMRWNVGWRNQWCGYQDRENCRAFILRASPKFEAWIIPRARDEGDGGLFYGSENLWLQNSATLRNAARMRCGL